MTTWKPGFPYGLCNFAEIRIDGLFIADNSDVIRKLEKPGRKHVLLCRPPRFGKSLLLSMLAWYYDEHDTAYENFYCLFEGNGETTAALSISMNSTARWMRYKVLRFNFTTKTGCSDYSAWFHGLVNKHLESFKKRYKLDFEIDKKDSNMSIANMANALVLRESSNSHLLVLIDDYDHWANQLFFDGQASSLSHDAMMKTLLPLREFFESLKTLQDVGLASYRTITVGVTPLPLREISTWNVYVDLTDHPDFALALGYTEHHVQQALKIAGVPDCDLAVMMEILNEYEHGYRFRGSTTGVFNPTLVLWFCEKYASQQFKPIVGTSWSDWRNWNNDKKFKFIRVCNDPSVKPSEQVYETAAAAAEKCSKKLMASLTRLPSNSPADCCVTFRTDVWEEAFHVGRIFTDCASLLRFMFYHGLVTIDARHSDAGRTAFCIPNIIMREEHVRKLLHRVEQAERPFFKFWSAHCSNSFAALLTRVLELVRADIYSSRFTETGPQSILEVGLPFLAEKLSRAIIVKSGEGFDLLIHDDQTAVFVELKRLNASDLIIVRPPYVSCSDMPAHNVIRAMRNADQLAIRLSDALLKRDKRFSKVPTVKGVVECAKEQLRKRHEALSRMWQNHVSYGYAVVQLVEPLFVDSQSLELVPA